MEAVQGEYFWGSGLNKADTLHTKSKYWFGKNQMGALLIQLRDSLNEQTQNRSHAGKHKSTSQPPQSQDSCSQMASSDSE